MADDNNAGAASREHSFHDGGPLPGAGLRPRIPDRLLVRYRPSVLRARVALVLVALTVGVYVLTAIGNLWLLPLADAIDAGDINMPMLRFHDAIASALNIAAVPAFIVSAISLLAWVSRVVDNTLWLTGARPRFSPREAIVFWFIPFASLVLPYQVMRDVVGRVRAVEWAGMAVLAWWLLYIFSNLSAYAVGAVGRGLDTTDDLRTFTGASMVYLVPRVVSGVLLMALIVQVEAGCRRLAAAKAADDWRSDAGWVQPSGSVAGPWPAAPVPYVETRSLVQVVASSDGPAAPPPPPPPGA